MSPDPEHASPIKFAGGTYDFTIERVFFDDDADTFGIEYTLRPGLSPDDRVFFSLEATDDLGHEYLSGGGVYDTDERRDLTRGLLSIQGRIHADATEVAFTLVYATIDREERVRFSRPVAG